MWIRSQNRKVIGDFIALEVCAQKDRFDVRGMIAEGNLHKKLGAYPTEAEALAVLDSIQARIDSGNTQPFQMPKAGEPMGKHTHVYCTNCRYFRIGNDEAPFCEFENYCDIGDPEDSAPLKLRPWYAQKAVEE